jgi:hypothetical protein
VISHENPPRFHPTDTVLLKPWLDHRIVCVVLTLSFFLLFISIRSNNFLAADGNYRCLEVWHRQSLFFHGAGHMLYPLNVFVWSRLLAALGFKLATAFEFLSAVETLNALAATASLALFFALAHSATKSVAATTYATVLLGLSYAFITQATNGNEPMVGLFWSLLALSLILYGATKNSLGIVIAGAALFAVSLATYQSTALLSFVALVIIYFTRQRLRAIYVGTFVCSAVVATIAIYSSVDWVRGIRSVPLMVHNFFSHEDSAGFLGITAGKVLSIPLGLTNGFTPLTHYFQFTGLRSLTSGGIQHLVALGIFPLFFTALLLVLLIIPITKWELLANSEKVGFVAAMVGFLITLVPLVSWDPVYDKLLIDPIACLILASGISLSVMIRQRNALAWLFLVPVAVALTSSPLLLRNHSGGTPGLSEVSRFASTVGTEDLVVGDWDPVSTLYSSIWDRQETDPNHPYESVWANNRQFFSFTTEANVLGTGAMPLLHQSVERARSQGGKVYFISLLDKSEASWNEVLGHRFGIPFSAMAPYRNESNVKTQIHLPDGTVLVRTYDSPASSNQPSN